ncbi:MAG: 50S ribosomal protein L30 [Candidatus Aenigmatarchaeota archaeon]|nr:MAG: 50S ribosomal protein L30 [Candidatus Aenigmarchaeota archaeon]
MWAVIRLRGNVNVRKEIKDTLEMLHLKRKFSCVLLPENDSYKGMLRKVKDYVTWGEVNEDILKKLFEKRGRIGRKRLSDNLDLIGVKSVDEVIKRFQNGEKLKDIGLRPFFGLTPPSKGFKKSIIRHYPKGELGYRGEKINELLERMI